MINHRFHSIASVSSLSQLEYFFKADEFWLRRQRKFQVSSGELCGDNSEQPMFLECRIFSVRKRDYIFFLHRNKTDLVGDWPEFLTVHLTKFNA